MSDFNEKFAEMITQHDFTCHVVECVTYPVPDNEDVSITEITLRDRGYVMSLVRVNYTDLFYGNDYFQSYQPAFIMPKLHDELGDHAKVKPEVMVPNNNSQGVYGSFDMNRVCVEPGVYMAVVPYNVVANPEAKIYAVVAYKTQG